MKINFEMDIHHEYFFINANKISQYRKIVILWFLTATAYSKYDEIILTNLKSSRFDRKLHCKFPIERLISSDKDEHSILIYDFVFIF